MTEQVKRWYKKPMTLPAVNTVAHCPTQVDWDRVTAHCGYDWKDHDSTWSKCGADTCIALDGQVFADKAFYERTDYKIVTADDVCGVPVVSLPREKTCVKLNSAKERDAMLAFLSAEGWPLREMDGLRSRIDFPVFIRVDEDAKNNYPGHWSCKYINFESISIKQVLGCDWDKEAAPFEKPAADPVVPDCWLCEKCRKRWYGYYLKETCCDNYAVRAMRESDCVPMTLPVPGCAVLVRDREDVVALKKGTGNFFPNHWNAEEWVPMGGFLCEPCVYLYAQGFGWDRREVAEKHKHCRILSVADVLGTRPQPPANPENCAKELEKPQPSARSPRRRGSPSMPPPKFRAGDKVRFTKPVGRRAVGSVAVVRFADARDSLGWFVYLDDDSFSYNADLLELWTEPEKPVFAVGQRVRVCSERPTPDHYGPNASGLALRPGISGVAWYEGDAGKVFVVSEIDKDGDVWLDDGNKCVHPSCLTPVEPVNLPPTRFASKPPDATDADPIIHYPSACSAMDEYSAYSHDQDEVTCKDCLRMLDKMTKPTTADAVADMLQGEAEPPLKAGDVVECVEPEGVFQHYKVGGVYTLKSCCPVGELTWTTEELPGFHILPGRLKRLTLPRLKTACGPLTREQWSAILDRLGCLGWRWCNGGESVSDPTIMAEEWEIEACLVLSDSQNLAVDYAPLDGWTVLTFEQAMAALGAPATPEKWLVRIPPGERQKRLLAAAEAKGWLWRGGAKPTAWVLLASEFIAFHEKDKTITYSGNAEDFGPEFREVSVEEAEARLGVCSVSADDAQPEKPASPPCPTFATHINDSMDYAESVALMKEHVEKQIAEQLAVTTFAKPTLTEKVAAPPQPEMEPNPWEACAGGLTALSGASMIVLSVLATYLGQWPAIMSAVVFALSISAFLYLPSMRVKRVPPATTGNPTGPTLNESTNHSPITRKGYSMNPLTCSFRTVRWTAKTSIWLFLGYVLMFLGSFFVQLPEVATKAATLQPVREGIDNATSDGRQAISNGAYDVGTWARDDAEWGTIGMCSGAALSLVLGLWTTLHMRRRNRERDAKERERDARFEEMYAMMRAKS